MTQIIVGDCRAVLAGRPECSVDAIVTDPPYELGIMGRAWDSSGVAFDVDTWRQCLRVLKPGGHMLAFGGTRTSHRMVCAIEDAGFQIRDSLGWVYQTGFPKSMNVGKAIDASLGETQTFVAAPPWCSTWNGACHCGTNERAQSGATVHAPVTAPVTAPGIAWAGWGTALKPAIEPICLARKPIDGTIVATVMKHGTGALNIGACRVGESATVSAYGRVLNGGGVSPIDAGRWPANVMLHEDVDLPELKRVFYVAKPSTREREAGFDALPLLGEVEARKTPGHEMVHRAEGSKGADNPRAGAGAGRKAKARGNTHATVKPLALMRELVRLVTPPGGLVLDPFCGSGTTGCAAVVEGLRFVGVELGEDHAEIARTRIAHWETHGAAEIP